MLRPILSRLQSAGPDQPRRVVAAPVALFAGCALSLGAASAPAGHAASVPKTIVVCAPGSPGTTAAAQPTMDAFARDAGAAAGWPAGRIRAVYHESAASGLKRLEEPDAVLALVSLPFFLQHEAALRLAPRLQVVQDAGATETWGLVAKRGRVTSAAALDGFEITGVPGYAPEFVLGVVLGGFGSPPQTAHVTFTPSPLAALRRAAAGEPVAVVVDAAQATALASLPFGADLEIVARSPALPGTVLCAIGARLKGSDLDALIGGLQKLHTRSDWTGTLASMRMIRFEAVDKAALEAARKACAAARPAAAGKPRP